MRLLEVTGCCPYVFIVDCWFTYKSIWRADQSCLWHVYCSQVVHRLERSLCFARTVDYGWDDFSHSSRRACICTPWINPWTVVRGHCEMFNCISVWINWLSFCLGLHWQCTGLWVEKGRIQETSNKQRNAQAVKQEQKLRMLQTWTIERENRVQPVNQLKFQESVRTFDPKQFFRLYVGNLPLDSLQGIEEDCHSDIEDYIQRSEQNIQMYFSQWDAAETDIFPGLTQKVKLFLSVVKNSANAEMSVSSYWLVFKHQH